MSVHPSLFIFFFFNDTATTEIYTLSLHDALPICGHARLERFTRAGAGTALGPQPLGELDAPEIVEHHQHDQRSEEHTSELQSQSNLVCRLLLEKKKQSRSHPPRLDHTSASTTVSR